MSVMLNTPPVKREIRFVMERATARTYAREGEVVRGRRRQPTSLNPFVRSLVRSFEYTERFVDRRRNVDVVLISDRWTDGRTPLTPFYEHHPFVPSPLPSISTFAAALSPPSPESICLTCGACPRRRRQRRRRFVTACPSDERTKEGREEGAFSQFLFCKRHSETKGKLITPPSLPPSSLPPSSLPPSSLELLGRSAGLGFAVCDGARRVEWRRECKR